jgi:HAE1 family hydrophobic/amphiphilic exporter-1
VLLSAFNALTLSPALAGLLLKPPPEGERRGLLGKFFGAFNGYFDRSTHSFVRLSGTLIRKGSLVLALLGACVIAGVFFLGRLPASFLPDEDQGYVYINMQLPNAASQERTGAAAKQVEQILKYTRGRVHHQRHWLQST